MGEIARISHYSYMYPHSQASSCGESPQALNDVSFTVSQGEFIVLTGFTGSGKTTLLRHLNPDFSLQGKHQGCVHVAKSTRSNESGESSNVRIGYVPQHPKDVMVAETLRDDLAIRLSSPQASKHRSATNVETLALMANDIIGFLGIASIVDIPVSQLSEGQSQLVALAAVLSTRPDMLLLDEPTAYLDSVTRRNTLDVLQRLNIDDGLTIVIAEHRLSGLLPMSDRIIALHHGRIIVDDQPRVALRTLYADPELRPLIPDVPRVFLEYYCRTSQLNHHMHSSEACVPLGVGEGRRELESITAYGDNASCTNKDPLTSRIMNTTDAQTATEDPHVSPILQVNGLSYTYPQASRSALEDITFTANAAQVVAVTGQSGSGKSTLFQLLSGVINPQYGTITWDMHNDNETEHQVSNKHQGDRSRPWSIFHNRHAHTRRMHPSQAGPYIGYVPQDCRILLNFEAGYNPEQSISHGIYDASNGEQQLKTVMSVIRETHQILILDEPTQGLDTNATKIVGQALVRKASQGCLVMISSHDPDFCITYATQAIVIMGGHIVAYDTPQSIIGSQHYSTTDIHRLFAHIDNRILTLPQSEAFIAGQVGQEVQMP